MLTKQDLAKISTIVATTVESRLELFKEDFYENFYTNPEIDAKFSQVLTAIDGIVKSNVIFQQEMASINHRVTRAEDWIDKAAPQLGVQFER